MASLIRAIASKRWRLPLLVGRQRSYALISAAVLVAAGLLIMPEIGRVLPVVPFFLPVYLVFLAVMGVATTSLLLIRARIEASLPLAILAAAFLFAVPPSIGGVVALPQTVVYRHIVGSGLGTAGYCMALWRFGFPLGLLLFALSRSAFVERRKLVVPLWLPAALAFALAAVATGIVYCVSVRLPRLFEDGHFTDLHSALAVVTVVLCLGTLATLYRAREMTTIECWTAVAANAAAIEALMSGLIDERYSLGWYATRGFGAVASAVVFCAVATQASKTARAIHKRLSAEEALRTLAETIPQIVWTALPTGRIDWANRRWFDYSGLGDAATIRWQDAIHPADCALFLRRLPHLLVEGREFEVDLRLRGADGEFRWFLTRVVPMRDSRGLVVRWYGTSTNVDEQRRQAAHLEASYAREHRIAAALQTAFLPAKFPRCSGLAFSHVYRPAAADENVGGDWYDAFLVGERRIAVCVGDVSGHGLDAAVRMLRVRELVRAAAFDDPAPSVVLARAARSFEATDAEQTVTALYGVVDCARRSFTYAAAGHPPPAFARDGTARSLGFGGLPFGIELRPTYRDHTLELAEGDLVTLYTDGLIEALRDPVEGERRLHEVLAFGISDAEALAAELVPARQLDDVAVVTIAVGPLELDSTPRGWRFHSPDAARAEGARASFALNFSACGATGEELASAELAFGELVCNVVRHAPGPVDIELAWPSGVPHLTVSDRGRARLPSASPQRPAVLAESGRGLLMLSALGMRPVTLPRQGGGTQITVVLACAARKPALALT